MSKTEMDIAVEEKNKKNKRMINCGRHESLNSNIRLILLLMKRWMEPNYHFVKASISPFQKFICHNLLRNKIFFFFVPCFCGREKAVSEGLRRKVGREERREM